MSAADQLDAALDRADDATIAAAARRFIHAHRWLPRPKVERVEAVALFVLDDFR